MIIASDLEGTLTAGRTWKGVGRYLLEHGQAWPYRVFFARRAPAMLLARLGLGDERAVQLRWIEELTRFFRGKSEAEGRTMGEWVVEHEMWPQRHPTVVAELQAHQQAGARVILVSGTYQPVLDAFAARLGAEALGTPLEQADGRYSGRLTPITGGERKVSRLRERIGDRTLDLAYGDTAADIPMLSHASAAVVINPDEALTRTAAEQGWRVVRTETGA